MKLKGQWFDHPDCRIAVGDEEELEQYEAFVREIHAALDALPSETLAALDKMASRVGLEPTTSTSKGSRSTS